MRRYEGISIEHLYMLLDDIRSKMRSIGRCNSLERGYPYFQLLQQKLEIERLIDKLRTKH